LAKARVLSFFCEVFSKGFVVLKMNEHTADKGFRYVQNIDDLTIDQLESHGYYVGFPCVHGHHIRDTTQHWCYHCANKIISNVCGFDINYLHIEYKIKYHKLWQRVEINHFEDCWPIRFRSKNLTKRVSFPSYRSEFGSRKAENLALHKALYQCAWGDVGAMYVTRTCKKSDCGNPLHMVSNWNRVHPPVRIYPFEINYQVEKLLQIAQAEREGFKTMLIEAKYKNTITHPLDVGDPPSYDEGG
jgi:hypothetical protein